MKRRMTTDEIQTIRALAKERLEDAENKWTNAKDKLVKLAEDSNRHIAKALTQIPGYEILDENEAEIHVDDFVVLIADLRDSTKHLLNHCAAARNEATRLKRVFIETFVLLPCLAQTIGFSQGRVTEYLGDGLLAFYRVPEGKGGKVVVEAHHTAEKCIEAVIDIINPLLKEEYGLPGLEIGIGISRGPGIVNWVGLPGEFMLPKVFGEAVYYASKCACGSNEILLSQTAQNTWPMVEEGKKPVVRMKKRKGRGDVDAYVVEYVNTHGAA